MPDVTFPGECSAYRTARKDLLAAELALKDQRETVAALRRALPLGGVVPQDYVFQEGPADLSQDGSVVETSLSALFAPDQPNLIVAHVMMGPDAEKACPMCSLFVDGYDAMMPHLDGTVPFVAVAKAPIEKYRAWARQRGWSRLRLLSSHGNSFNRDYNVEVDEGQLPALSVFTKAADGQIHHRYTSEGSLVFEHHRAMDLYSPLWNLLDLLPEGRGDFFPSQLVD